MTEKRNLPRRRVLKAGRIVFNGGGSTIDCTIRNLSPDGARLVVVSVLGIPDAFELAIGADLRRPCRLVWRTANELGVAFTSPASP